MVNYVYVVTAAVNIVNYIAGASLTWSSPEQSKLTNSTEEFDPPITTDEYSWISSLLPLGAAFGPFVFGYACDKVGRKISLLALAVPLEIAYIVLAFARSVPAYYVARLLIGFSVGGAFTVVPIYVGEIAEDTNRGALGSIMNVLLCLGLLTTYSLGPYVSVTVFNIVLAVFPILFFVATFFLAPESPHYYISKNDPINARIALEKIRGSNNSNNEKELEDITKSVQDAGKGTIKDVFKTKGTIKAFIISIALVFFQQLSGINAVLFFSQQIFEASGSTIDSAIAAIIVGATQFVTSFITPVLVDRLGRRILLIFSGVGMTIAEIPLGIFFILKKNGDNVDAISFLPILCLVFYIMTYNSGFGPLPWTVMGELFPPNIKSAASSATAGLCWLIGFFITKFFKQISDSIGSGPPFLIFSGFCVASVLFCIFYLFETKGKSLQEIQDTLES